MQHQTMWGRREAVVSYPSLDADREASVLIVGGGITGLALARVLQESGHAVTVVELRNVGLGTTGHSSGHLDVTIDTGMAEVVRAFGADAAKLALDASTRALERAHQWTSE